MRQRSELLHLKAVVIQLEQLSSSGDPIAMTSVVGQPEYWRRRLGVLLNNAGITVVDRELVRALLQRLDRVQERPGASDGPE